MSEVCWHDGKREVSTDSYGTGQTIRRTERCLKCRAVRVLVPCPCCGALTDEKLVGLVPARVVVRDQERGDE